MPSFNASQHSQNYSSMLSHAELDVFTSYTLNSTKISTTPISCDCQIHLITSHNLVGSNLLRCQL